MIVNIKDLRIRDPFIYKENGIYYLYGTHRPENGLPGFYGYKSNDLKKFEGPYPLFVEDPNIYGSKTYWAPELHHYNNKYYLFCTMQPKGHKHREVFVLVSDSPLGKFENPTGECVTPKEWDCIDGTLFIHENKPYMIFVHEWVQVMDGEMQIAELSEDLMHFVSEPRLLFKASDAKWTNEIRDGNGIVTDGPFLFRKNGKIHMIWSSFYGKEYALSLISSDDLYNWKQEDTPLIGNNSGHGMLFKDKGKVFLSLHGPNSPFGLERLIITEFADSDKDYDI